MAALFARTGGAFRLTLDANVLRVSVKRLGVSRVEHEVGVDRIREVRVRRVVVNASTSHRAAPVGKYFSLQVVCAEGTLDVAQTADARIAACLALHVARSTGVEWRLAVPAA